MDNDDIELGYYGLALRRRWWLVALCLVGALVLAWQFVPEQTTTYSSDITVLVEPETLDVIEGNDPRLEVNEATEMGIASSDPVALAVIKSVGLDLTVDELHDDFTIAAADGTRLMKFTFEAQTPQRAQEIVEAFGDEYIRFNLESAIQNRAQRLALYDAQIAISEKNIADSLAVIAEQQPDPAADPPERESAAYIAAQTDLSLARTDRNRLQGIANQIRTSEVNVGRVLGAPSEADEIHSGINRLLALAVAAVIGTMGGIALALFADRVDRRIRDVDDIEGELDVPVVGTIPRITEETPVLVTAVRAETDGANAFRRFGTAVVAMGGEDLTSVLIVSANEKEGRTTTAVNTALALRQAGRLVYLVSADRQNPDIDRVFGLTDLPGLDDFFRGQASREEVDDLLAAAPEHLGLRLIPSGRTTGVPQPLSAAGIRQILKVVREQGAVVVFDAPPALRHPDALSLASMVDATYVVVGRGRSRRQDLAELRMQLRTVNAHVAGALRNQASRWKVSSQTAVPSFATPTQSVDEPRQTSLTERQEVG